MNRHLSILPFHSNPIDVKQRIQLLRSIDSTNLNFTQHQSIDNTIEQLINQNESAKMISSKKVIEQICEELCLDSVVVDTTELELAINDVFNWLIEEGYCREVNLN